MMWDLIFIVTFLFLFCLPFAPALRELYSSKDASPLPINQQYVDDAKYFAKQFLTYEKQERSLAFVYDDYLIFKEDTFYKKGEGEVSTRKVIVAEKNLTLSENQVFTRELFSKQSIHGGTANRFYSILAYGNLFVNRDSVVDRWVYASKLYIDRNVLIKGRIAAEKEIVIHPTAKFHRINAPMIKFQNGLNGNGKDREKLGRQKQLVDLSLSLETLKLKEGRRWVFEGDLAIPPGVLVKADMIVHGTLSIGAGSRVEGNIKAYVHILLESDVVVIGSMICQQGIEVKRRCCIRGPLVSEAHIQIESATVVGTYSMPTTILGNSIKIEPGVITHGEINVRDN